MESFYFGKSEKPLFGLYYPPPDRKKVNSGVVLCNPFGHESLLAHRPFRQLAIHLSRAGFHVLRFDYYGCGDSAGSSEEGNLSQWIEDISTAIDEIKETGEIEKVSLVGLRLGATLCDVVGIQRNDLKCIVLWEPVINGKDFIEEVTMLQNHWLRGQLLKPSHSTNSGQHLEILGVPLTPGLCDDIEKLNLLDLPPNRFSRILLLENTENSDKMSLREYLQSQGLAIAHQYIPDPKFWENQGMTDEAMVPIQTLQAVEKWLSQEVA